MTGAEINQLLETGLSGYQRCGHHRLSAFFISAGLDPDKLEDGETYTVVFSLATVGKNRPWKDHSPKRYHLEELLA